MVTIIHKNIEKVSEEDIRNWASKLPEHQFNITKMMWENIGTVKCCVICGEIEELVFCQSDVNPKIYGIFCEDCQMFQKTM